MRPEQEDRVWALAQADAVHRRCVLSPDVLAGDRCACGGRLHVRPGVVDVQVKLTTLAGLDEHPGLIPGLGVTLAPIARQIAVDPHTRPTWRWSILDDHGELLHHGLTRHRPTAPQPPSGTGRLNPAAPDGATPHRWCACSRLEPGNRRGSVELQLTPTTLDGLTAQPDRIPGWQPLLADIAAQVEQDRTTNPPGRWHQTDQHGDLHHHGHTGRMPNTVEDAFIRARDRSCQTPHCPVIARRCELDHRIEHAQSGPSHRGNVDCRCRRHHHLRHRRGFHINKTDGTTTWTVPSGRTYTVSRDKDIILVRKD